MRSLLKKLFFVYVIFLALYVTYTRLLVKRYGQEVADFKPAEKKCFQGGDDWRYCVYKSQLDHPTATLYVFHGKGQTEEMWEDGSTYAGLLQSYWQSKNIRHPRVVTISFGKVWILAPPLKKHPVSLLDRMRDEVIPKIEQHVGSVNSRFLMGNSMGGLNAINLVLKDPTYFKRAAILCPVVYDISPLSSWSSLLAYAYQHGARLKSMMMTVALGRQMVTSEKEWQKYSPLEVIDSLSVVPPAPKLYITAGLRDQYAVFKATEKLAIKAKQKGFGVYWRPISGGHCAIDVSSLGQFLKL